MITGRRSFLSFCGLSLALAPVVVSKGIAQPTQSRRPNPTNFQSGDFIWPKPPSAFVPFSSGVENAQAADRQLWETQKATYLQAFDAVQYPSQLEMDRAAAIRELQYLEFRQLYLADIAQNTPAPFGSAIYVGHVGIVEIARDGTPWVIEALMGRGVIRQTYADWLASRPRQWVWHGRLRGPSADSRTLVASEASKHLGKPYDFWNFDLGDDAGFYCSKLVWLSVRRALGLLVDGNATEKRLLWLSPKKLLRQPNVLRLHDPGSYAV